MKRHSSILTRIILVSTISLFTLTATAQFKKPLSSPRDRIQSSDAKWNVGIIGGPNFTTWLHIQSDQASNWFIQDYKIFDSITRPHTESMGYFGGIGVERMLKSNLSVGLNVVYAQHKVKLGYLDNHFPYAWDSENNTILFGQIVKIFTANYRTIEAYVPFTYYIGLASTRNINPYVYIAPRLSYILPMNQNMMTYSASCFVTHYGPFLDHNISNDHQLLLPPEPTSTDPTSVPFNGSTYRKLNFGGTIGIGSLFRINISNYYFLIKFDVSANMDAITTFKKGQVVNDEFIHQRYNASAYATLTLMLPIKKPLQDACIRWGKYN